MTNSLPNLCARLLGRGPSIAPEILRAWGGVWGIAAYWQGGWVRSRRLVLVAVVEVLTAVVLAGLAWWCWHRGVTVTMRRGVALSRVEGGWWAAATGVATLAGILLLDAGRSAVRARGAGRLA